MHRKGFYKNENLIMMKKLSAIALATLISSTAAAEIGIGLSAKEDTSTIFFPMDLSDTFKLEPGIAFSDASQDEEDFEISLTRWELSLGAFLVNNISQKFDVLLGARFSLLDVESEVTIDGQKNESSSEGFGIAPTLGFEYFVIDNLSLGGEVALAYTSTESEVEGFDGSTENSSWNTETALNVRFYF